MPGPTIQDVLDKLDVLEIKLSGIGIIQEKFIVGNSGGYTFAGEHWAYQGFTATETYKITSIRLQLYRLGLPGFITVSIRETDGEGKPTGSDLCSGTIDGNTITTNGPQGEWYSIFFSESVQLLKDTQYSIVARAVDGDGSNYVRWYANNNGGYSGGVGGYSLNSGGSWVIYPVTDHVFEVYSSPGLSDIYNINTNINSKLPEAKTG